MKPEPPKQTLLRKRAEERLTHVEPTTPHPEKPVNIQKLVHELQVHQIELEMQNEQLRQSRSEVELALGQITDLYDMAPIGYFTLDVECKIEQLNLAGASLLGKERARVVGQSFLSFLAIDGRLEFHATLRHLFSTQSTRHVRMEATLAKPTVKNLQISLNLLENGRQCRMTVTDVSELKLSEEALRASNSLSEAMLGSLPFPMQIVDANGRILYMSQKMIDAVGRRAEGEYCWGVVKQDHHQCDACPLKEPIVVGRTVVAEVRGLLSPQGVSGKEDGGCRSCFYEVHHTGMMYNGLPAVLEIFIDLTERKNAEMQQAQADAVIWRQANYDKLTGLPNRNLFQDRLEQALNKMKRDKVGLTLLYMDIDNFKQVNDTLGHHLGDELLAETARRITKLIRETDTLARLSGDEFTVILPGLDDPIRIEAVTEAIRKAIDTPFNLGGNQVHTSISIGITRYPVDGMDLETLLKNADKAMYEAKSNGRNQFSYFTQEMEQAARKGRELGEELQLALTAQQFFVCYQPIVELGTQRWIGAEALLRWRHPIRGVLLPNKFIPKAEQMGIIGDMGYWVLAEAIKQVKRWLKTSPECAQVSINKSPREFSRDKSFHRWLEFIQRSGVPAECINVEITESLLASDYPGMSQKLQAYKEAGMMISLDDFGTGYSSLAYLQRYNIDILKIDRSFVANMETNKDSQAIIKAIIGLAHGIAVKTTAEGVETAGQLELLAEYGCDYAQGFLFGRPMAADAFVDALEKRQPRLRQSAALTR